MALGLPRPSTEFERDILKAIMAKDAGHAVRLLFLISKPGAQKKCAQPGRAAIINWVRNNQRIDVQIRELRRVARGKRLKRTGVPP